MSAPHDPSVRIACDSLVALGNSTADGAVIFAKNSDRPAMECQPLLQQPRRSHSPDTRLRCTYIDIPQVAQTARLIASRPFWCWGVEHGLNEHGVAIGNHTVFSKDALSGKGLIGMDLVRLGLERGGSAEQAVEVMAALIEAHGQGGSGYGDKEWPYHNSFLVADRRNAFILETSDRHWVTRRVADVGSVSNHLTIASDWDALSDGAIEHAIAAGWWSEERDERFDFSAAYRDTSIAPDTISSARHRRTCELLEAAKGAISVGTFKTALRDHYGRVAPAPDLTPADARYFSVCMHAEPVGTTTASLVSRLPQDADEPLIYWAGLGSPCVGAFVPLFMDGEIPDVLTQGGAQPSPASAWWRCKQLLMQVEPDWERRTVAVRRELDALEAETDQRLFAVTSLTAAAHTTFMQETVGALLQRVDRLMSELSR